MVYVFCAALLLQGLSLMIFQYYDSAIYIAIVPRSLEKFVVEVFSNFDKIAKSISHDLFYSENIWRKPAYCCHDEFVMQDGIMHRPYLIIDDPYFSQ